MTNTSINKSGARGRSLISLDADEQWLERAEPTLLETKISERLSFVPLATPKMEVIPVEEGAEHLLCIFRSSAAPSVGILVRGAMLDTRQLSEEPTTYVCFKTANDGVSEPYGLVKSAAYFKSSEDGEQNGSTWDHLTRQASVAIGHDIISACRKHGISWLAAENGPNERIIELEGLTVFPVHLLKSVLARDLQVAAGVTHTHLYDLHSSWFYMNIFPFVKAGCSTLLDECDY